MASRSSIFASAIICTLNRGPKIGATIESLLEQRQPGGGEFEILIVDNGSTAENAGILKQHAGAHPDRIRYTLEPETGESSARNCATRTARGQIHAHIDDDAIADPDWLEKLCAPFADQRIGGVGGRIRLHYESPPPDWVDESLTPYLSAFDEGDLPRDLQYPDYPRGANMAFRVDALRAAGPFSTKYGRKGTSLLSYSETEMYYRVARAGYRIVYAPDAGIDHIVSPGRLTEEWFRRRIHWQGRSMAHFAGEHDGRWSLLKQFPQEIGKWLLRPRNLHHAKHGGWIAGAWREVLGLG